MPQEIRYYLRNTCDFNGWVDCPPETVFHRICDKCGWNPVVTMERVQKIQERRNREKSKLPEK